MSLGLIALASLAGAWIVPVSALGRASLASVSRDWALLLAASWLALAAWALLFAGILHRARGHSPERGLYWAAVCHSPLLLSVALLLVLYQNDVAYHVFAISPYGSVLRSLAISFLVLAPAVLQLLRLFATSRISLSSTLLFLMVVGIALPLRFNGLAWGLPGRFHPDEYSTRALNMFVSNDMNPHFFLNPTLMIYAIYYAQALVRPHIEGLHLLTSFFGVTVNDPRNDFWLLLVGRVLSASAGMITIGAVYLTARELFGRRTGLIAALLLSVALLNVRNSHFATNDVTAGMMMSLSLLFCARVATRGTFRQYFLSALFGGLATSTKYTCVVFVAALLCAHFYHSTRAQKAFLSRDIWKLLACAPVAIIAFLAISPYAILDSGQFLRDGQGQFLLGRQASYGQFQLPTWLLAFATYAQGFGFVPLVLAIAGLAALARRNLLLALLVGSVPLIFALSLSQQRYYYARFVVPSLPAAAVLAAFGLTWLSERLSARWRIRYVFPVLLAIALVQGAITSIQFNMLIGQEDTRTMAAEWIEANTAPDATVAVEVHSLMDNPWGWGPNSTSQRGPYWVRNVSVFWPEREEEFQKAIDGSYDYVIVTSWGYNLLASDPTMALRYASYLSLPSRLELRATFAPGRDASDVGFAVDDMYSPFYHLFDRARPGPTVFVYSAGHR